MDIYTYTIVSTRDRLQSNEMGPNPWRGSNLGSHSGREREREREREMDIAACVKWES